LPSVLSRPVKMAAAARTQIHKFEETLKGYLYEGPLTPYWSIIEQKTNLKRERIALGNSISLLLYNDL
jgi:hypothetical protein